MTNSAVIFHRSRAVPLLTLLFVSLVSVLLVTWRAEWTKNWRTMSLVWNLFLAWLPLLLALLVCRQLKDRKDHGWAFYVLAVLWLLFFPNAPYIYTDLMHVTPWFLPQYWIDFSLVLLVAFTGFCLGFVSLYLMQSVVAEKWGRRAGWVFVLWVTALSGLGVYLGRILRWNSWDVVLHPMHVSHAMGHMALHPGDNLPLLAFSALFATFLFLGYLMLYALTRLQAPVMPKATS